MTDKRIVIGGSDDLVINVSRCLRMRFNESSCHHCVDICPHEAVTLDNGLSITPQQCRGCLLCTTVCPVGALEQSTDFYVCLAQLSKVPEPVMGCIRTKECSNATLACLGGLSEEHLLALCYSLTGILTLNLSLCGDCPNNLMITRLRQRLKALFEAELSGNGCRIIIAESAQDIHYRDESVDRRSFFKSFRNSLFKSADIILSNSNEKTERRSEYAVKLIPIRRALLNSTRNKLSHELAGRTRNHFDSYVSIDETCTNCQGCVAICPTGALQSVAVEEPPFFEQRLCSGCCLCREFCLEGAVRIYSKKVS